MRMMKLLFICSVLSISSSLLAQSDSEQGKLQHFGPDLADRALDPCQDFYAYSCTKWLSANPIPADQTFWGTASGLSIWNLNVSRETMEQAAAKKEGRSQVEQQVGDYWSACMNEKGIDVDGMRDLTAELKRIHAIKEKSELIDEVAHLHQTLPGAWQGDDNQTNAPMFGFGSGQDLDDASLVVISATD